MLDNATPFFIVGSPRSGTTLLERILNSHSHIFVPPETAFFRAMAYEKVGGGIDSGKGDLLEFSAAYAKWRPLQLLGITAEEMSVVVGQSRTFRDLFLRLMERLAERSGKSDISLVGEKSPVHLHHIDLIRGMFPDARFIATLRDGRAVVASRMKHPLWNKNLVTFAREWVKDSKAIRKLRAQLDPTCFMEIRYEDLVGNPERELRRLCAMLGVEFEPGMLRHHDGSGTGFDDYYRQPWMSKSTSRIDSSRAEAWHKELSRPALALVEWIIRQELLELGYQPGPTSSGLPMLLWFKEHMRDITFRVGRRIRRDLRP